jgi:outer membrane protein OmpA-like peptidoglycan-associated protein
MIMIPRRHFSSVLIVTWGCLALSIKAFGQDAVSTKIDSAFREAKEAKADIYSPKLFSMAFQSHEKYKEGLASGKKKDEEANKALRIYAQSVQTAKSVREKLGDQLSIKEYGLTIQAEQGDEDNWKEAENSLDKAVQAIQNGESEEAKVSAKTANTYYTLAVTNTLKKQKLSVFRQQLNEAEKTGATKRAPISFQRLSVMVDRTAGQIDQDKNITPEVQEFIRQCEKESNHAAAMVAWLDQADLKKMNLEQVRLQDEERLQRLASRFNLVLDFKSDLALAVETLVQRISEVSQAMESNKTQLAGKDKTLEEQNKRIESQEKEIRRMSGLQDSLFSSAKRTSPLLDDWMMVQNELAETKNLLIYEPEKAVIRIPASLLFKNGNNIDSKEFPRLMKIQQSLKKLSNCIFTIEGHTDADGQAQNNLTQSQFRAQAVRDYFTADGTTDPNRYIAIGFGETKPIAGGDTPNERKQNSRIDVVIQRQK